MSHDMLDSPSADPKSQFFVVDTEDGSVTEFGAAGPAAHHAQQLVAHNGEPDSVVVIYGTRRYLTPTLSERRPE